MCGIAGILINSQSSEILRSSGGLQHLKKMTAAISHRGPDGEGFWANTLENVFLGHRRLAVIDLSADASQPMHFNPGKAINGEEKNPRYSIIHNGEIYNYLELRNVLQQKGYVFRSQSDTEVILAAYDHWKENCLQQFDGMFAFAIWDEKEQVLFAARDRFGEKPFYYFEDEKHFIFASEMKALWAAGVPKDIDDKMLLNYITLGHVQNSMDKEQCFFQNIYSLPPSHYLRVSMSDLKSRIHKYWGINKEIKIDISPSAAVEKFNELFSSSIKKRLRSDVTVGSSLSGGLDSSSIIAFISQQRVAPAGQQLKTFSAVFPGFERDESTYIDVVVNKFGTESFRVSPTPESLIKDFEQLCFHQEEPFSSSGIYAQYKIFELAKQQGVKVLLDGQGADEILAGYPRYIHWYLQEVLSRHKLGSTQKERRAMVKNGQPFGWDIKNILAAFLPAHAAIQLEKKEYHKTIKHPDIDTGFLKSLTGREWEGIHKPIVTKLNDILYFNTTEMGLEELLRFADRNSMAHGRETRLPFLDHQLVQFIFSLPAQLKIHDGWTKCLLRYAMDKKLPDEIVWRKEKVGFETPQLQWMQNKLMQDYMQEARRKLVTHGILKQSVLNKKIQPRDAYAADNYDWRYLCAAHII